MPELRAAKDVALQQLASIASQVDGQQRPASEAIALAQATTILAVAQALDRIADALLLERETDG